jgi:uncharacterized Fe-S cluster-containing MiaB family protein
MAREVFVLASGRCSHAGCVFCGYGRITGERADSQTLKRKFDRFFSELKPGTD